MTTVAPSPELKESGRILASTTDLSTQLDKQLQDIVDICEVSKSTLPGAPNPAYAAEQILGKIRAIAHKARTETARKLADEAASVTRVVGSLAIADMKKGLVLQAVDAEFASQKAAMTNMAERLARLENPPEPMPDSQAEIGDAVERQSAPEPPEKLVSTVAGPMVPTKRPDHYSDVPHDPAPNPNEETAQMPAVQPGNETGPSQGA